MNTPKKFSLKNEQIKAWLESQIRAKKNGTLTVYNDGVWNINVEVHPYGAIRCWVSFEYTQSNEYDSSLVYVDNNEVCGSGFPIKKAVKEKIISMWNYINKSENMRII